MAIVIPSLSFVMPREGGAPGTRRPRSKSPAAEATGSPAFAGDDEGRSERRQRARVLRSLCTNCAHTLTPFRRRQSMSAGTVWRGAPGRGIMAMERGRDRESYFVVWEVRTEGVILPEHRLPAGPTVLVGLQHVVAMFGATVLAPLLMGFDPNVAIFFSGIATLIFFVITGGRVPSYLGSSFAFIGPVLVATGAAVAAGANPNIGVALGGIIAAGALYTVIGLIVLAAGHHWVEKLMPPVVTGGIVAAIGLVLAPIAINSASGIGPGNADGSAFARWIALITVAAVGLTAVYAPGLARRIPILIGAIAGYIVYYVAANHWGYGPPIDFSKVAAAAWFGQPNFATPVFDSKAMVLIAPVAIVLVAENLGHIKAIGAMTGRNFDSYLGRAFLGDGIATMLSGSGGGTGVTTYAENMGVMAITRIYSTALFIAAALIAILLGFSPK